MAFSRSGTILHAVEFDFRAKSELFQPSVLLQKEQLLFLENHDFYENELEYHSISYERACEKAD